MRTPLILLCLLLATLLAQKLIPIAGRMRLPARPLNTLSLAHFNGLMRQMGG